MNYSHDRYDQLVQRVFDRVRELSQLKGGEYSGDVDRLANFRRNAEALGVRKETVLLVYAAKHWDAISQYVKDQQNGVDRKRLESIAGRAEDLIVYMILFLAMLDEGYAQTGVPQVTES